MISVKLQERNSQPRRNNVSRDRLGCAYIRNNLSFKFQVSVPINDLFKFPIQLIFKFQIIRVCSIPERKRLIYSFSGYLLECGSLQPFSC